MGAVHSHFNFNMKKGQRAGDTGDSGVVKDTFCEGSLFLVEQARPSGVRATGKTKLFPGTPVHMQVCAYPFTGAVPFVLPRPCKIRHSCLNFRTRMHVYAAMVMFRQTFLYIKRISGGWRCDGHLITG